MNVHRRSRRSVAHSMIQSEGLESRLLLAADLAARPFVANEILVQYLPAAPSSVFEQTGVAGISVVETIHSNRMQTTGYGRIERVSIPDGVAMEDAILDIQNSPFVAYAEPNYIYAAASISNDPYYTDGDLWGMYGDDSPSAIGPGGTTNQFGVHAENVWNQGTVGSSDIFVGIIDTGVQVTHPDLVDNIWVNPFDPVDGVDNDGNGYVDDIHGWDFVNNDNSVYDGTFDDHGTHVAGTIGGTGGNASGVVGVNWDVTMIPMKFLGQNGGTTADAVKALDYLTDLKIRHGLNIVASNNSWGGGGYSQSLADAIIRSAKQETLFIAAAGNSTTNNDNANSYPSNYDTTIGTSTETAASYDAVLAVASITSSGSISGFSSYGATTVDIGAPGSGIWSSVPNNTYDSFSGTSMAAPHVAGAAALFASTQTAGIPALSIKDALLDSATATASLSGKTLTGGRLNVYEAIIAANPPGLQVGVYDIAADLPEGNSGSTPFTFEVRLDEAASTGDPITVDWSIDLVGQTANAADFSVSQPMSGTITFSDPQNVNALVQTVAVNVAGDRTVEVSETFNLTLTGTSAGSIGKATAGGTIQGDDAELRGRVWNDANADGAVNGGETGLPGVTLYLDTDLDGTRDSGEVSTITSSSGDYLFAVAPGSYAIRTDLTSGQSQTFPFVSGGTVEPDDYAAGTLLNTVDQNVSLTGVGTGVTSGDVTSTTATYTSTGTRNFGSAWNGGLWDTSPASLRADFSFPVNEVSIDFISDDSSDFGHLRAFDANGTQLAEYVTGNLGTGAVESMVITRGTAEISYVLASGQNGQFGWLDNLEYSVAGQGDSSPIQVTVGPEISSNNDFGVYTSVAVAGVAVTSPAPSSTTTEAGGTVSFDVRLTKAPTASVTVPVSSSNSSEGTAGTSSLVFTPTDWDVPQTVTVTGQDDSVDDGDTAYTIVLGSTASADTSYSGLNPDDVNLTNEDDDVAGISVGTPSGTTTTEAGGTVTFTVQLTSEPTSDVTLPVSSSDITEGTVDTASLTFTSVDWNIPQTVTVTGADDTDSDGDVAYSVVLAAAVSDDLSYKNADPSDISLTNLNDDIPAILFVDDDQGAGYESYFQSALDANAFGYDTWDVAATGQLPSTQDLVGYGAVIWNTGYDYTSTNAGLSSAEQTAIQGYLDLGGRTFISGADILYNTVTASFRENYLKVANFTNDVISANHTEAGVSGNIISDGLNLSIVKPADYAQLYIDAVSPSAGAEGLLLHGASASSPYSAVSYQGDYVNGGFGMVFMTVPFESISNSTAAPNNQNEVMNRIINFLMPPTLGGVEVSVPSPSSNTTEDGGTVTFTVALTEAPLNDVTIPVSSSDSGEGTAGTSSLVFTPSNWDVAQTVTVTGQNDAVDDGD
ncbi:MAG: S8 family serine peptidase, partial [Fuerstiella sp.]|nr:S8 family serine peptidase [Fuerstiella sp.]